MLGYCTVGRGQPKRAERDVMRTTWPGSPAQARTLRPWDKAVAPPRPGCPACRARLPSLVHLTRTCTPLWRRLPQVSRKHTIVMAGPNDWLCGSVSTGRVRLRRRRFATTETRCPLLCGRARVNAVTESKDRETVPERWNAAGPGSDMWMDAAQDPRFAAGTKLEGERATLLDYLRAYRLTMEMNAPTSTRPSSLAGRCRPLPCPCSASSATWPTSNATGSAG